MLCNLGNTSTAGNDTNNNANTNSSMEDDDSYPLPTIYRYVTATRVTEESQLVEEKKKERKKKKREGRFLPSRLIGLIASSRFASK
jgi:hypothetical protein